MTHVVSRRKRAARLLVYVFVRDVDLLGLRLASGAQPRGDQRAVPVREAVRDGVREALEVQGDERPNEDAGLARARARPEAGAEGGQS